ncbi:MAG TPA: hypothetical protein VM534_06655 [Thermoanaerobaculia bacterium]|nr:hypothetical protein [Thermoanaerobaculia bacterium]
MPRRKPAIFVPGFPGSSLELPGGRKLFPPPLDALLRHKKEILDRLRAPDDPALDDGVRVRSPIRYSFQIPLLDLGKEAQSLYDLLEDLGYDTGQGNDFIPVGWDWRMPVDHPPTLLALEAAIRDLSEFHHGKVVAIVHSTGGLVLRALLESRPHLARQIERIIAIGVPWAGLIKSFRYAAVGEAVRFGPLTLMTAKESRQTLGRAWAAYDLLPPHPEVLRDEQGEMGFFTAGGAVTSPLVERRWIRPGLEHVHPRVDRSMERFGHRQRWFAIDDEIEVTSLVGWGAATETRCELLDKGPGRPPWFEITDDGDGTVPRRSAAWLEHSRRVPTLLIPIGWFGDQIITRQHSQLWNSTPARAALAHLLSGREKQPWVWAAADGDDAIDRRRRIRVRIVASDEKGRPLSRARASVRIGSETTEVDLRERTRAVIEIGRTHLRPNIGTSFYRFEVRFEWEERGKARRMDRPLIIQT